MSIGHGDVRGAHPGLPLQEQSVGEGQGGVQD